MTVVQVEERVVEDSVFNLTVDFRLRAQSNPNGLVSRHDDRRYRS